MDALVLMYCNKNTNIELLFENEKKYILLSADVVETQKILVHTIPCTNDLTISLHNKSVFNTTNSFRDAYDIFCSLKLYLRP